MKSELYAPAGTPGGRFDGESFDSNGENNIIMHGINWIRNGMLADGKTIRYSQPSHLIGKLSLKATA